MYFGILHSKSVILLGLCLVLSSLLFSVPVSPTATRGHFPTIIYVEEHRSLGGSIISRLDNGAFVGLIYELLVFS